MKQMRLNDVVAMLKAEGFELVRSNGHVIYSRGAVRVVLAHKRLVSPGVMRGVHKAIAQAKSESEQKARA
jgi:predicted RNA binding protein YcfA (HicA-like mRNA interferase family)